MRQMNFSGISRQTLVGRLLRLPFRLVPNQMIVPILQGELRGKKWIVGSGNHGCWLGSYEFEKQKLFVEIVQSGDIVLDIGAHIGFYTLLASELVGLEGHVCAFEPAPRNLAYLCRHIKLNRCRNVEIFVMAVGKESYISRFEEGRDSSQGHLSSNGGKLVVPVVSLDELYTAGEIPIPDCIKMDIEGAELDALVGARVILKQYHPTVFLATHGRQLHKSCCKFLVELGYNLHPVVGNDVKVTDEILAVNRSDKK